MYTPSQVTDFGTFNKLKHWLSNVKNVKFGPQNKLNEI